MKNIRRKESEAKQSTQLFVKDDNDIYFSLSTFLN